MLDTWKIHKDFPKLQSLDHVVSSMAEVVGRIDESFLPSGIIDLLSTLERYAGMKGDARGLLRVRDFLRRKYKFWVLRQMRRVSRADRDFNFLLNARQ